MSKNIYPGWSPSLVVPHVRDASDDLRALRGDASGGLLGGYAGSVYTVWRENVSGSSGAGGGTAMAITAAVPSGYYYVAQIVMATQGDTATHLVVLGVLSGGSFYEFEIDTALPQYMSMRNYNEFVLSAGEQIQAYAYGLSANQVVAITVLGYKVRL